VVLLASSVAGNAVVHGLAAYRLAAPWWLVVAVSAVAPAVLGAVVHLAVLVAQGRTASPCATVDHTRPPIELSPAVDNIGDRSQTDDVGTTDVVAELLKQGAGRRRLARELGVSEHEARRLLAERNGVAR
jgi:hypothetical protein